MSIVVLLITRDSARTKIRRRINYPNFYIFIAHLLRTNKLIVRTITVGSTARMELYLFYCRVSFNLKGLCFT